MVIRQAEKHDVDGVMLLVRKAVPLMRASGNSSGTITIRMRPHLSGT